MADITQGISSDDALTFAINSGGSDDETEDVDDPATRGQTKAAKLDMFKARPWKEHPQKQVRPTGKPLARVLLTPGASRVDVNPEPTIRER